MSADRARLRELLDAGTPRPWLADVLGSEGYAVRECEASKHPIRRIQVARCGHEDWETDKANAYLIVAAVSALPALLDALDRVEALAGEWARDDRTLGSPGVVFKGQAADQLRAALGEMDDSAERGPR